MVSPKNQIISNYNVSEVPLSPQERPTVQEIDQMFTIGQV